MPVLHPIRTLHYPLIRSLSTAFPSAQTSTAPILSSIVAQRPVAQSQSTIQQRQHQQRQPQSAHSLHTSSMLRSAASSSSSSHEEEDHYDPPTGWLFGIPPGEKYQNEGWERIWVWGFWGSLGVAVVAYAYKPDTSYVFFLRPYFIWIRNESLFFLKFRSLWGRDLF